MKSTRKLFSLLVIVLLTFSNAVKITTKANVTPTTATTATATTKAPTSVTGRPATYIDLVTNPARPKCPIVLDPKSALRDAKKAETGTFPAQGPYVQPNPFKLMNTKDTAYINYIFDYLDEMIITKEKDAKLNVLIRQKFAATFEEAKKMKQTDTRYSNMYTAPKLLFYFSKGTAGTQPFTDPRLLDQKTINNGQQATPSGMVPPTPANPPKPTPDDAPVPDAIFAAIKSYNSAFDKSIWENGVTPMQVFHIMNEWGWGMPGEDRDMMDIKKVVDTYDFNGDGNLNPEEFTIFQIHQTIKVGHQCAKHCFRNIIDKVLEPLFMYLDCDSDGYINSHNMWEGLKNVKRGDGAKKFNMYGCIFPVELNKDYRTNCTNDLILKATFAADGFLNKNEFIKAILTGFWERETDTKSYGTNAETMEGLKARWASNGTKDLECDKILYYFNA
jgi:Ca2+-binding EF-hand superfamily protein